jgi:hypothetical protein
MLARALSMLLVLTLGACSISGLLPDWTSADVAGPEPAARFLIANKLKDIVGDPASAGTFEISAAKRVDSIKGASWVACLKVQKFPLLPHYYAVFIQSSRVADSRSSVLIDQCELQSFTPFDWAADVNNPSAR